MCVDAGVLHDSKKRDFGTLVVDDAYESVETACNALFTRVDHAEHEVHDWRFWRLHQWIQ